MHDHHPPKKRRWKKILLLIWVVFVVLLLFGPSLLLVRMLTPKKVNIEKGTFLEIELGGILNEHQSQNILSELAGDLTTSVWSVRNALRNAAEDEDIAGVVLKIQTAVSGWGVAEEILAQLDDFRESGKPVYALFETDMMDDLGYFLATGADQIWVTPEIGVLVNGLASEVAFWRGTLEKLHIEPEVIMYKEYKSAGEPYVNREMSPHMREALTDVLTTIDTRFRERLVARRGIEEASLGQFLALGMGTTQDMIEYGLVDKAGYLDEIQKECKERTETEEYQKVTLSEYSRSSKPTPSDATETLAVVFGEGAIVANSPGSGLFGMADFMVGPKIAKAIRDAAEDDDVKAIVFRVNSPGGSAVGSDLIRREIRNARDKGKPVIVSMSSVAGSGGYWVSMDADAIVAQPTTITGSIGVVFSKFNLTGFYDWIGANVDTVQTAPYADILGFTPLEGERREKAEQWVGSVYESFKSHVAQGRGLPVERVEEIAKGRIWSGSDALDLGLVDAIGGWETAFRLAKEKSGLDVEEKYPVAIYPKPKSILEELIGGDLLGTSIEVPTEKELLDWAHEFGTPKVWAKMPDVRVY
jgi:protease-4